MREVVLQAKDTEIIKAMAESVYWVYGAAYPALAEEWRDAYQHICDQGAYDLLQDELEKLFGGYEKDNVQ